MNIIYNEPHEYFKEIKCGDTFMCKGALFIKTNSSVEKGVNLANGAIRLFEPDELVVSVECEVVVK